MLTITTNCKTIAALDVAIAKGDVRYYLEGIMFSPKDKVAVSTDGHRLIVMKGIETNDNRDDVIVGFTADTIRDMRKASNRDRPVLIKIEGSGLDAKVTVELGGMIYPASLIDGMFPDWRKVVPAESSKGGNISCFNARYLADFAKAAKYLTGDKDAYMKVAYGEDGLSAARVTFPKVEEFTGVLMPCRE